MTYSDPIPLLPGTAEPPVLPPTPPPAALLETLAETVAEPLVEPLAEPLTEPLAEPPRQAGQVAALCWRLRKGHAQVLLVTSRDTHRWVLPKGWPIAGLTPQAAAAREAWEEAGVEGKIGTQPLGQYCYDKRLPSQTALPCAVQVFPLRVQTLKASFPERKQRRRKWFAAEAASLLVAEPDLSELLRNLSDTPALLVPTARRAKRAKAAT